MPFELTCDWFEHCQNHAAGMAAHPIYGVIPICAEHVRQDSVRLITTTKEA